MMAYRFAPTALLIAALATPFAAACTGITLTSEDGAVVFARTMEWGAFDLESRLVIYRRGHEITSPLEGGTAGATWKATYGTIGFDALGEQYLVDGMNEKGLSVNVFYHPGFADYPPTDAAEASASIGPADVCQYLLTTCATVEDVKRALETVQVVSVVEPTLGIAPPLHLMVTEPSGKAIVIEFCDQEVQVYDAPLGCITNAPEYPWHLTNLRNYLNLSPVALPTKRLEEMDFTPLGVGTGMTGLPGDFTPPSRFVRAVAFTQTARPTTNGQETLQEAFRILDNFNLPLGPEAAQTMKGMRSSTLWTTAYDTKNLVLQYHTMFNRRVRQVDLKQIDFSKGDSVVFAPMDRVAEQDIEDVTPTLEDD